MRVMILDAAGGQNPDVEAVAVHGWSPRQAAREMSGGKGRSLRCESIPAG
jgi:hypothetical protein